MNAWIEFCRAGAVPLLGLAADVVRAPLTRCAPPLCACVRTQTRRRGALPALWVRFTSRVHVDVATTPHVRLVCAWPRHLYTQPECRSTRCWRCRSKYAFRRRRGCLPFSRAAVDYLVVWACVARSNQAIECARCTGETAQGALAPRARKACTISSRPHASHAIATRVLQAAHQL
jgi:hypothetical protein